MAKSSHTKDKKKKSRTQRKKTAAQHKSSGKAKAAQNRKLKELKASKALKSIFYDTHGYLRRVILEEGYLILSYLTPYNHFRTYMLSTRLCPRPSHLFLLLSKQLRRSFIQEIDDSVTRHDTYTGMQRCLKDRSRIKTRMKV